MIAKVFAAFRSRLESAASFFRIFVGCVMTWRSLVVGSISTGTFSGLVLVLLTLVTAVVVVVVVASDMVGSGRPITPTIAAARPPLLLPVAPAMHKPKTYEFAIIINTALKYIITQIMPEYEELTFHQIPHNVVYMLYSP